MLPGIELLVDDPLIDRAKRMLQALADTAEADVRLSYSGARRTLVMYGVGHPKRMEIRRRHLEAGGRVVMWDLGYFDRPEGMRLAIDAFHPTQEQLLAAPVEGQRRPPDRLREDGDHRGPVLLVGLGRKSGVMLGLKPMEWELGALSRIRQLFPNRQVRWRPKFPSVEPLAGTEMVADRSIEQALKGCSLVVCRHSNVAIDACIAGVPVMCEDGAARALYAIGSGPGRAKRAEFLRRLGWWNWKPGEAAEAWAWIKERTQ